MEGAWKIYMISCVIIHIHSSDVRMSVFHLRRYRQSTTENHMKARQITGAEELTGQDLKLVAVFGTNADLRFPSKDLCEMKFRRKTKRSTDQPLLPAKDLN